MRLFLRRLHIVGALQLFALLGAAAVVGVATANAAMLTVTTTADSGAGSLRAAIAAASDGDTIQFDAALNGQTISLTSAELAVDKSITINGPGSNLLTVSRSSGTFRIFHVMPGRTTTMGGLTISGGNGAPKGSGVLNDHGTLTLDGCTVQNNFNFPQLSEGGGIYNDGSGSSATLNILNSSVSSNGSFGGFGGGIYNDASNSGSAILTITNSTVNDNGATNSNGAPGSPCSGFGGGIYNDGGTVTITNSVVNNNGAGTPSGPPFPCGYGGGIWSSGALTITNSTLNNNWAGFEGGGTYHAGGTLTITNSTVSGNGANGTHDGMGFGYGGGISNYGALTISNSTISGNYATNSGGGLYRSGTVSNSTISGNTANQNGGGIYATGALEIGNTILKAGTSGANIFNNGGTITSHGYNLSSDNGGGFLTAIGDQINTDPMLGPLQNNGGPTFTHDLLTGSPAIDAGDPSFTPPPLYDQRGFGYSRVFNGRIDIGSLEAQPAPTPSPTPTATATATATPLPTPPTTPTPILCTILSLVEGFDTVTPPALPAGWHSSFKSGPANCTPAGTCPFGTDWVTTPHSSPIPSDPNYAFHDAPGCVTDSALDTFSFVGLSGSFVSFDHDFDLESGFDGAVLEISINGGPYIDFNAAGGNLMVGGYNGTISTAFQSPIAGRQAWTGNSGGYIGTIGFLPPAAWQQNVVLRFRLATDCSASSIGWRIDDIRVAFPVPCDTPTPTPATPTATPTASATPTATATATATATSTATATPTVPTSTPTPTPPYFRVMWEGFDAVTAPALPSGWVTSFTPGPANCTPTGTCALGTNWATSAGTSQTAPNAAFHDAPGCVTDSSLNTLSIFIPTTFYPSVIYFWQNYNLEAGHDGGVLEISIEGGAFTDIVAAGGSFLDDGYNGTISTAFLSPIAGRPAWTGNSGGYINTSASLPLAAKGHNVVLRFRLATDCSVAGTGWYVDSIQIAYLAGPTPTATATATLAATATATATPASPTPTATATVAATATATATPTATICGVTHYLSENFDRVTAPALPPGWISSFTPGPANCTPTGTCALGSNWATTTTNPNTPPNCAFHDAPACVTDSTLDTPSFVGGGTNGTMLFIRQSFDLENGRDGAVLEISINGGPFVDFMAAGGGNLGYNGTISSGFFSPIAGRAAWTGNSGGYWDMVIPMPSAALGHNVRLRFRLATDCSGAGTGWRIDNILVADNVGCQSPTPTPTPSPPPPTPTATATATATASPTATATATATSTPITVSGTISYCSSPVPGPVPYVTLTLTGSTSNSILSNGLGNYTFPFLPSGGSYTVTPTKTALIPGANGISTVDVIATQRHFLSIGPPLAGCRLIAADVNLDSNVNTSDVIAIQRFVLALSTGIANTGQYQFTPANRTYTGVVSNQTGQNYDTLIFGDVATPSVEPATPGAFDPNANGQINVVVVQPDGKILLGGSFTTLSPNGGAAVTRNHIARLNLDGTLDTGFNPNASERVFSIAVQADGKILAAGVFNGANSIGGQTRNRIARLDATTGAADSFNPNADSTIDSIAVQADGKILAAGFFSSIGGQPRNRIARLDPTTGLADSLNPNADGEVTSIAVQADGKILAGGWFTNIGGQLRNHIARLGATSGLADFSFNPNANFPVDSIAVQADGKILVGGSFNGANSIGGQPRNHAARLDPTNGLADSFDPNANTEVLSFAVQTDGRVLAGGGFNFVSLQTRNRIARLDATTGAADSFNPNANEVVYSIAMQADGKILVGGNFTNIGGQPRNYIARLDPTSGQADSLGWSADSSGNAVPDSASPSGNQK